jgi:hypothetical protein
MNTHLYQTVYYFLQNDTEKSKECFSLYLQEKVRSKLFENESSDILQGVETLKISYSHYEDFLQQLEKVNKKCINYKLPTLKILSKEKKVLKKGDKEYPYFEIKLQGQPVRMNGWSFYATIEHGPSGNNIRFVPGLYDERIKNYINASRSCDFCKSNRDRNNTYIVINQETDEIKQVGGQCLQKYIGNEAKKLAKFYFSIMPYFLESFDDEQFGEGGGGFRRGSTVFDVDSVLPAAVAITRQVGGYKKADDSMSTAMLVKMVLDLIPLPDSRYADASYIANIRSLYDTGKNPTQADKDKATKIIEWFNNLPDDQKDSAYMASLESIIQSDMVSVRSIGILCSIVSAYDRAMSQQASTSAASQQKVSNHVGSVGAKIPQTKVEVVYTAIKDSTYGEYQLVKMVDDSGNVYTWFNTGAKRLDNNAQYNITGTVKKHDSFNNVKSTVLTRVKAVEI